MNSSMSTSSRKSESRLSHSLEEEKMDSSNSKRNIMAKKSNKKQVPVLSSDYLQDCSNKVRIKKKSLLRNFMYNDTRILT